MPKEETLYEPIKKCLELVLYNYYLEESAKAKHPMYPGQYEHNPYLEITASGKISEDLKKVFDEYSFYVSDTEGKYPDLMGYVKRQGSGPKELITVEIKSQPIELMHILQANLYQRIFNSALNFLISPAQIPEKRVRFITSERGKPIKENVIIMRFVEESGAYRFECDPRLRDVVPRGILRKYFEKWDKK